MDIHFSPPVNKNAAVQRSWTEGRLRRTALRAVCLPANDIPSWGEADERPMGPQLSSRGRVRTPRGSEEVTKSPTNDREAAERGHETRVGAGMWRIRPSGPFAEGNISLEEASWRSQAVFAELFLKSDWKENSIEDDQPSAEEALPSRQRRPTKENKAKREDAAKQIFDSRRRRAVLVQVKGKLRQIKCVIISHLQFS